DWNVCAFGGRIAKRVKMSALGSGFKSIAFHLEMYYPDRVERGAPARKAEEEDNQDEEREDGPIGVAGVLTLNRPERGNSISAEMFGEMGQVLAFVEDPRNRVGALVVTGSGRAFCTGMDLQRAAAEAAEEKEEEEKKDEGSPLALFSGLRDCAVPVVARINGPAVAGGWGLAFCADFRVADEGAWFSLPETRRGIVPALISSFIVPETGPFLAKLLMLTGRRFSAADALSLGLITAVSSPSHPLDTLVAALVRDLLASAPAASRLTKRMVHAVAGSSSDANRRRIVEQIALGNFSSPEASHGIQAFLTKKTPNWYAAKL
ncbi:MAG: enoyl-CoA hydratase/isomerase family protein, partial [archaeon]|nr:enoyl-CoA hydratase/isomerase family protein [archaeon]